MRKLLRRNFGKKLAPAIAGLAVFAAYGQNGSPGFNAKPRQSFEVATVKPVDSNAVPGGTKSGDGAGGGRGGVPFEVDHGRVHYTGTLYGIILRSYLIQGCLTSPGAACLLLSGGPGWVNKDIFEIQAKAPEGTPDYVPGATGYRELSPQLQIMLQALLAERFNLKLHREKKQLPVLALTVGKNGPKSNLKKGAGETIQRKDGSSVKDTMVFFEEHGPNNPNVHLIVRNTTLPDFMERYLTPMMGHLAVDRTGLKGDFTFTMDYEKDPDAPPGNLALVGPAMLTAFQEQLGLKLESTKTPLDVLVIDHAEKPSPN
jgi:uncharacterized protein (TIGR03435 family)